MNRLLIIALFSVVAVAQPAPGPVVPVVPGIILGASMGPQFTTGTVPYNYTFTFSSLYGVNSIGVVNILANDTLNGAHACYLAYDRAANKLYLVNDAGTEVMTPITPGDNGTLQNSQCVVDGSQVFIEGSFQVILRLRIKMTKQSNSVFWLATSQVGSVATSGWLVSGLWVR